MQSPTISTAAKKATMFFRKVSTLMDLATIIANNRLDTSLTESTREYPDPVARAASRLPWDIAVQILASSDAQDTIAYHLAALSIADAIYKPWNIYHDFAALDWVREGNWEGNETEEAIQAEWDEYNG